MKRHLFLFVAAATITAAAAGSLFALTQTAPSAANETTLAAKDNAEGAVTVSVTPQDVSQTAGTWRFAVQLNTHATPLSQDMVVVTSLAGGKVVEARPTAWEGDPPGGHHRRGILVFQPITPVPATLTLHIREVGGIADRTFTWDLGGS
jgi:archaellum component FlaG (FlaF/FlaG flagellin family)